MLSIHHSAGNSTRRAPKCRFCAAYTSRWPRAGYRREGCVCSESFIRGVPWLNAALALVCAAVFLLVLLWPLHSLGTTVAYTPEERSLLEALESGEIIRLHVLADGDDAESQRVKLCVRDALIAAFGEMLMDASQADADTVYETLLTHVSQMEEAALACARENGFTGPVPAEAGVLTLPAKTYGQVTRRRETTALCG